MIYHDHLKPGEGCEGSRAADEGDGSRGRGGKECSGKGDHDDDDSHDDDHDEDEFNDDHDNSHDGDHGDDYDDCHDGDEH